MNEDRQLQQAIYNSIQTANRASGFSRASLPSFASAPRVRPAPAQSASAWRGKLFSDLADSRVRNSFPAPLPRYVAPAPPGTSGGGAGRRDVLMREGARPAAPAGGGAAPQPRAVVPRVPRSASERQPAGPRKNEYLAAFEEYVEAADAAAGKRAPGVAPPPRGSVPGTRNGVRAPVKLDKQPVLKMADGWTIRTGRGNFAPGDPVRLEGLGPGFFFVAYDSAPESAAVQTAPGFDLKFQVKVLRTDSAESTFFFVILSIPDGRFNGITGTSANFVCLSMNAAEKTWKAERYLDGRCTAMYGQQTDRSLAPNASIPVEIQVRGGRVSLLSGRSRLFADLEVPQIEALRGPVGVAAYKSRFELRGWSLAPLAPAEGPAAAAPPAPLPRAPYAGGDDPALVEAIERDILDRPLGVTFDDVAGLADAKRALNEAVVLPLIIPEHFTGIREPWRGVLLFGPPGTGKTLLARAVASMGGTTFFACSAASLVSKWRGESEKLVRTLFNLARHHSPSVVFFDELEALAGARGADGEHEASRRFLSELLQQIDGIASAAAGTSRGAVMVLGTTNAPWDLDEAMRRRLEKRVYIPPPDREARRAMFAIHLRSVPLEGDVSLDELAGLTENYSGSDVRAVCRDASLAPVRRLAADRTPGEIRALAGAGQLEVKLTRADFLASLARTRPSIAPAELRRFEAWQRQFGAS